MTNQQKIIVAIIATLGIYWLYKKYKKPTTIKDLLNSGSGAVSQTPHSPTPSNGVTIGELIPNVGGGVRDPRNNAETPIIKGDDKDLEDLITPEPTPPYVQEEPTYTPPFNPNPPIYPNYEQPNTPVFTPQVIDDVFPNNQPAVITNTMDDSWGNGYIFTNPNTTRDLGGGFAPNVINILE